MPRKILIILSIIIIIFLLILGALFFITKTPVQEDESAFTKKVREIFPFGKPSRDPDTLFEGEESVFEEESSPTSTTTATVSKLRKIHGRPTSGSIVWKTKNEVTKEEEVRVRFVDRATGHVFETTKDSLVTKKISNTTLPKTYEAIFLNPDSFVARFLDNTDTELIKTYTVTLKNLPLVLASTTASTTIIQNTDITKESIGLNLDDNIKEITASPLRNRLLYSLYNENESGTLIVANTNNTNKKKIYESPLREWLLSWNKENEATISTKPSGYTQGFAYNLNTNTGNMTKILGGVFGLTIKPVGEGDYLVGRGGNGISLFSIKQKTPSTEPVFLGNTLPEKCVASKKETFIVYCAIPVLIPNGIYPDYWYQGRVTFNDSIWKINTNTATTNLISIPERDGGESMDAISLEISEDDSYLTFINKKNLSFWGLILSETKKPISSTATSTINSATTTATTTQTSTSTKTTN